MNVLSVVVLGAAALLSSAAAHSQIQPSAAPASAAEPEVQRINVTGERSIWVYPYQRAYETIKTLNDQGKGDVALLFRFVPRTPGARVDDIKLRLEYEGVEERIDVDLQGSFRIVPNDTAFKNNAHFVVNKRREDYTVQLDIAPVVSTSTLTVGVLRRVIDSGIAVRKTLMPWYARVVMATIGGIRICAATPDQPVTISVNAAGPTALVYGSAKDSPPGKPHCADIERSTSYPDQAEVIVPVAAHVDYYSSMF